MQATHPNHFLVQWLHHVEHHSEGPIESYQMWPMLAQSSEYPDLVPRDIPEVREIIERVDALAKKRILFDVQLRPLCQRALSIVLKR